MSFHPSKIPDGGCSRRNDRFVPRDVMQSCDGSMGRWRDGAWCGAKRVRTSSTWNIFPAASHQQC